MASVVLRFTSDEDFGHYLSQLEDGGLSGNITKWMVEGYHHILIGDDLPTPTPELFNNNHAYTFYDEADMLDVLNNVSLPSLWEIRNKGAQFVFAGLGGGDIISSEAQAVIDSLPGGVNAAELSAIISFVNSQSSSIGSGNWALIDSFVHFGTLSALNSLWDWKRESAMTNVGSTHQPGTGRSFDGSQSIDTLIDLSVGLSNYKLLDALMGVFVTVNNAGSSTQCYAGVLNSDMSLIMNEASGTRFTQNSTATFIRDTTTFAATGLQVGTRVATNQSLFYLDGVNSDGTKANAETSVPSGATVAIGGRGRTGASDALFDGTISSWIVGTAIGFNHTSYFDELVILNAAFAAA